MATYHLAEPPRDLLRRRRVAVTRLLAAAVVVAIGFGRVKTGWIFDVAKVAGLYALSCLYALWNIQRDLNGRARITVTVSPDGVRATTARGIVREIPRANIRGLRNMRVGPAFLIRSVNRSEMMVIPSDLDGVAACRAELLAMGIPDDPPPTRQWQKVWAIQGVFWSFLAAVTASTRAVQIVASVTLVGCMIAMWAVGFLRGRKSEEVCATPSEAPKMPPRSRSLTRRLGIGLCIAGAALMISGAWWTGSTDGLGFSYGVIFVGVLFFAISLIGGGVKAGTIALASLAVSGLALGGAIYWLAPTSDLGPTLAATVAGPVLFLGFIVLAGFGMSALTSRIPWLGRNADVVLAVAYVAMGVWFFRHDHGAMLAVGVLLTVVAAVARNEVGLDYLLRAKPAATGLVIVIAVVAALEHQNSISFPMLVLFWSLQSLKRPPAVASGGSV
jgi:hypothetical protein